RRLCQLLPRRGHRRHHRPPPDDGIPRRLRLRAQARHARSPPTCRGRATAGIAAMETLLLPFQFEFMRSAMLIAVLVAIPAALLSCFLVLKGWSLMGDAISHAVFPGVVIAYIINIPYAIGAFVAGMFAAVAA